MIDLRNPETNMIDLRNPLALPLPFDATRESKYRAALLLDMLRTRTNRFGLEAADFADRTDPIPHAVFVTCKRTDLDAVELKDAVLDYLERTGNARPPADVDDYLDLVENLGTVAENDLKGTRPDVVLADWANRLRHARSIREADAAEAEALRKATEDPNDENRAAYADAMQATQAARRAAPVRRESLSDVLDRVRRRMVQGQGNAAVGIETPVYPILSSALCGWRGLVFLAAAPGIGKTTMATAAALDAVRSNTDVCAIFVSFEMPTDVLVERTLSQLSGVSQRMLRLGATGVSALRAIDGMRLNNEQYQGLQEAESRLRQLDGRLGFCGKAEVGRVGGRAFADDPRGCLAKVEQLVLDVKRRSGARRTFVVLDHFGAIPVEPPDGVTWPNEMEKAKYLVGGLVTLRDRLDGDANPVVCIAQARKADFDDPTLASVMGTADISYAADAVVVFRNAKTDEDEPRKPDAKVEVEARIVKGRDMVYRRSVRLLLDPRTSRIDEAEDRQP